MTQTDGHVGIEELADDRAGLLPEPRSAEITAHLRGCARCSADADRLDRVTTALHDAPHPAMPAAVSNRIDAALSTAQGSPQTVVPLHAPRSRRRGLTWAGGAAIAAAFALVAVVLVSHFATGSNPGSADSAAGGAGAGSVTVGTVDPQKLQAVTNVSNTHYTHANLAYRLSQAVSGHSVSTPLDNGPQVPAASAGGNSAAPNTFSSQTSARVPHGLQPLTNPNVLTRCISQLLAGPPVQPLYVDLATYDGKPAVVVVVPDSATKDLAYVTDATCGQPNYRGTVMDYAEVPKS